MKCLHQCNSLQLSSTVLFFWSRRLFNIPQKGEPSVILPLPVQEFDGVVRSIERELLHSAVSQNSLFESVSAFNPVDVRLYTPGQIGYGGAKFMELSNQL